jgi:hypothetical protein
MNHRRAKDMPDRVESRAGNGRELLDRKQRPPRSGLAQPPQARFARITPPVVLIVSQALTPVHRLHSRLGILDDGLGNSSPETGIDSATHRSEGFAFWQCDIIMIDRISPQEAIPMNAPNDDSAARGLRGWWASPPRSGLERLIVPYEYRHLRSFGTLRMAGGLVAAAAGVVCLSYSAYGWAAFFLVIGALNLAGGSWYLNIARSARS